MNNLSRKKTMLVILLATILLISIGFAAFTTVLKISPSASFIGSSSNFKVVFSKSATKVDTSDVLPDPELSNAIGGNATIDGTTISNLSANFTKPNEKVVYKFYAYNDGVYEAYLNSITFLSGKKCTPTGEGTEELMSAACDSIRMTVQIGNIATRSTKKNITNESIKPKEAALIILTLEYAPDGTPADGPFTVDFSDVSLYYATAPEINEDVEIVYTGTIYRHSTVSLTDGDSLESKRWCIVVPILGNSCSNDILQLGFSSKEKCELGIQEVPSDYAFLVKNATCEQETETYTHEYETDLTAINQPYYLKHDVVNNIVTASYACITYTEDGIRKDVCVKGGASSDYASNQEVLRRAEPYFNTLDYNSDSNNYKGLCAFTSNRSRCLADSINLYARYDGSVRSYKDTIVCRVDENGRSICYDENEIPFDF